MEKLLTCIGCPMGCQITVTMENGEVASIKGNTCKKGAEYARDEVTCPTRMVTSVLAVEGAKEPCASRQPSSSPRTRCLTVSRRSARPKYPCRWRLAMWLSPMFAARVLT